jgi:2-keto-4-pentenoate hydratase/2-oxohepta-3-ene-1,7-dioic acid hydratase in catechol pathway
MADLRASDVTLLPPIVEPRKIMCIGLNYRSHALEAGHDIPKFPTVFFRMANAQVGHGAPLMRPHVSEQFDFEGELAVVIGKPGRNVSEAHAYEYVAGYTCFNDGSVRDWQRRASQWGPGKNFPASGACGPCLVTADEIADPPQLELITRLNGQIMQRANISDLIFGIPALIAYCSTFTELQVGDLIVTGTPGGVGGARNPPLWMTRGDLIEVSISGIGTLANRVADETPPATEV